LEKKKLVKEPTLKPLVLSEVALLARGGYSSPVFLLEAIDKPQLRTNKQ
jgi:hypothetical protein